MIVEETLGIRVEVQTAYLEKESDIANGRYFHAYRITITNNSDYNVQLLTRKWEITDSNGSFREVEGEGVVGKQPDIEPGESYTYISGCNFQTPFGKMKGRYHFLRKADGEIFEAKIPEFFMVVPWLKN